MFRFLLVSDKLVLKVRITRFKFDHIFVKEILKQNYNAIHFSMNTTQNHVSIK